MQPIESMIKNQLENIQAEPGNDLRKKILANTINGITAPYSIKRRIGINTVLIAAILTVFLSMTAFAYGDKIIGAIQYAFTVPQYPAEGYTMINETGKHTIIHEVNEIGEILERNGYIFSLDKTDNKYTLKSVSSNNGETIFLKPTDSGGFSLKKGDKISLYAVLNTTQDYVDKETGDLVEVGCFHDDILYKTFFGKLTDKGATFNIEAPCDGEFMIYITNCCAAIESYGELSIYYSK